MLYMKMEELMLWVVIIASLLFIGVFVLVRLRGSKLSVDDGPKSSTKKKNRKSRPTSPSFDNSGLIKRIRRRKKDSSEHIL
jgi:hypothetical protein